MPSNNLPAAGGWVGRLMPRRQFLTAAAASLAASCLPAQDRGGPARRPNIVLIVSDDHGYGDAGCYGKTNVDTPTVDAIAAGGVRFTRFRVNPLCAPTRSSILSGLYSVECGMWRGPTRKTDPGGDGTTDRGLKKDVLLLPQYLKRAGYATGIFGKWHLGYESPNLPNDRGFDEFVGFLGGSGRYRRNRELLHNGAALETDEHLTDLFTERAIAFIRAHRDRPFFCYLPYNAVHGPLWRSANPQPSGKEEWLKKYADRGIDFPRRDYCAILDHMDDSVGRVRGTLRELGLERNTLFIFVSDNGAMTDEYPGNNGPLRDAKGSTYEGGIRVPAVMQWPGVIPAGTVSQADAAHFDLFSTILDAAGVPAVAKNGDMPVRGTSLLPHLRSGGRTALPERYLFWDLYGRMAAVHGPWKIVANGPNHHGHFTKTIPVVEQTDFELFNLDRDLGEANNLAAENPEVYGRLKSRYVEWFKEIAANYERKPGGD